MAGKKLPSLRRREVDAFFAHFALGSTRKGQKVTGVGRCGPFSVHLDHSGTLTPQQLNRALSYLCIARIDFFVWYDAI